MCLRSHEKSMAEQGTEPRFPMVQGRAGTTGPSLFTGAKHWPVLICGWQTYCMYFVYVYFCKGSPPHLRMCLQWQG